MCDSDGMQVSDTDNNVRITSISISCDSALQLAPLVNCTEPITNVWNACRLYS